MKINFRTRILLTIIISAIICIASSILVSRLKIKNEGVANLIEKSSAILSRIEVGSHYVAQMKTLDTVIAETMTKHPDGNVSEEQKLKILKSVPIYAAFEIGKSGAAEEHYTFRIASDAPRKPENKATEKELLTIQKFNADKNLKEIVEESEDGKFILVSRPIRINQERQCLICHGHPDTSPWKNGKDILGYQMENMKDGDLRAIFTIVSSLDPVNAFVNSATFDISLWGLIITILASIIGFMIIKKPVDSLSLLATHLSQSATDMAHMSTEIATTSAKLSEGATQQAAAIEETSSSMEEMSAMVKRNSESAENSQVATNQSQKSAEKGKETVGDMIRSIEAIDESNQNIMQQINESNQQISEVVQVINDIGEKTKVINEIVFQTKLLSFNASVEAARAGEHGKGFAVVAEEVGNLAQMSGNASAEISQMLESSIQKVKKIVDETHQKIEDLSTTSKEKVQNGTEVAKQCGVVLDEIVSSVQSVTQMVAQISESSQEQSKGVQEINKAMVELNSVTQLNTHSSQESSSAAEKLSDQAESLKTSVESLLMTIHGK